MGHTIVTVSCHAVFQMTISRHDFFDIWTGCILHVPTNHNKIGDLSLSGSCVLHSIPRAIITVFSMSPLGANE